MIKWSSGWTKQLLTMSVLTAPRPSKMLLSTDGVSHLPPPTGDYQVGFTDVVTPATEPNNLPVLFRLFYPAVAKPKPQVSRWPTWFPNVKYAEAYIRYKFPNLGFLQSIVGRLFVWLSSNPRCPIETGAEPLQPPPKKQWPVVIFSHGLSACRATYAFLCYDLASRGYCVAAVEHGDESACVRTCVDREGGEETLLWLRHMVKGEPEYPIRNKQVKQRVVEVGLVLDVLETINTGRFPETGSWRLSSTASKDAGDLNLQLASLAGKLDLSSTAVAGHSFGGATTVLALATDDRLKVGVALDSWMFPIKDEKEVAVPRDKRLLFINCEKFQYQTNLKVMKRFEVCEKSEWGRELNSSNVLTVLGASHHASTDLNVILKGSYAGWFMPVSGSDTTGLDPYTTLLLHADLLSGWLERGSGRDDTFDKTLAGNKSFLAAGVLLENTLGTDRG